jgi:hypothetical protein
MPAMRRRNQYLWYSVGRTSHLNSDRFDLGRKPKNAIRGWQEVLIALIKINIKALRI